MATTAWAPPTERLEQVKAFMAERVLPNETAIERQDADGEALLAQLQDEVRAPGCGRRTCRRRRAAPARASSTTRI